MFELKRLKSVCVFCSENQIVKATSIMFIPCIVNDLQILTVPASTQFYYLFHPYLAKYDWNA